MKTKRIVLISTLVLLLLTIFIFSGQNGAKSINTSDAFASKVIDKLAQIKKKNLSETRKQELIYETRFLIRKIAHFALYFLLGIITYLVISIYKDKNIFIISLIICIVFASIDEIHQLFIVGRTAQVYDVFIDTLGSGSGIIIAFLTNLFIKRKQSKNIYK